MSNIDIDLFTKDSELYGNNDEIDVDLFTKESELQSGNDEIIIEITGLKSINSFIGLNDTPFYYEDGKFFKIDGNKVVYTDIEWKDLKGNIEDSEELIKEIEHITEVISKKYTEQIVSQVIDVHNTDVNAHPYIQNIIEDNYNTLDEKIDGINANLTQEIEEVQQDVNDKYNELIQDIDDLTDVVEEDFSNLNKKIDDTKSELDNTISDLDTRLTQDLATEITNRENADITLQENIDTLSEVVEQHYSDLTQDINDLVDTVNDNRIASENRDIALGKRIDDITIDITDNYATKVELQNETTLREQADNTLQQNINTLSQTVSDNYTTLDTKIDTTSETINQRITEVAEEINATIEENVTALQQADTNLQSQITTNKNDIADLTQVVQDDYDELKGLIDQEIEDRENADTTLQNNINAEAKTRKDTDDSLQDQIDNLSARGHYLSTWDATTGLAGTNPPEEIYIYKSGDYFVVSKVGEINYKPSGTQYTTGVASSEIETEELAVDDTYFFDGSVWHLQINHGKTVSFANLAGEPNDNTNLKNALDSKQPVGDYATKTELTTGLNSKQNTISDLSTIRTNANNSVQYNTVTNKGLYLATHPELSTQSTILPFIHNDIAYLTQRGGSYSITRDGQPLTISTSANMFNGKPNYLIMDGSTGTEWVIDVTLPPNVDGNTLNKYLYGNVIYIDFGRNNWSSKYVKIEYQLRGSDTYTQLKLVTNNSDSAVYVYVSAGATGLGAIRFTLREPLTTTSASGFRIAQIGVINYQSNGTQSTLLGLGGGTLYGDVNFASGELTGYQKTISDLSTIRSNAQAGKDAKDTIDTYGDIVTHNTDEFQIAGDYATKTELEDGLNAKQDTIEDLEQIRNNAQAGADIVEQVGINTTDIGDLKLGKQDISDDSLVTLDKTVPGAINELDAKIKDIQLFKFPDATIIGTPTINNGQVSNFSSNNYLILPFAFDTKDRAFEINMAFTTGSNVSTTQNLLGGNFCIALLIEGGVLKFRTSNNGTSWNVADITTSLIVQPNTNYFVKIEFNKLNYKVSYSINGEDYTQIGYLVSTLFPRHGQVFIGIGNNQHNPFLGIINLNKCYIKLNNSIIWQGMDDAGLATRADISLSNLDELGQAKFDAKQNKLIAGTNINIDENTNEISVTGSLGAEIVFRKWSED